MVASGKSAEAGSPDTAFIVGPGRSGTTLLYKMLCLHPSVAYLSNFETRLAWLPPWLTGRARLSRPQAKVDHWFNDSGNAYLVSRPMVRRLVPNPVEGERLYTRLGMAPSAGLDGPPDAAVAARFTRAFRQLREAGGCRVFVSKRTANNRRIPALEAIFDRPSYVNLLRDGRDVAASLSKVAWWPDHRLWWDESQRTPAQITGENERMIELCARNWTEEVEEIERGLAGVDRVRILDVRYEELLGAPVAQMNRIFAFLGLPASAELEAAIKALGLDYKPNGWTRNLSAAEVEVVERVQSAHLNRLGYA